MLEDRAGGPWQPEPEDEWGVIELVADDQTVLVDQPRKVQAVGGEPHPEGDRGFGTNEFGHRLFQLQSTIIDFS